MSTDSESSYKQILKATSIFGGVQVVNILIAIVRSKIIAVLLGPIGIGISGMLTVTIGFVSGLTNFGLGTSAVRDVSSAYESENNRRIAIVFTVLNRWVWITGLLGMVLTMVFSPFLSYLSFGNYNYTIAFVFLSLTLLINQISSGQLVVLQGGRKISLLAKANLLGSFLGLCTSVPLYYVWGTGGIVPALIISSFVSLLSSSYFRRKIKTEKIRVSKIRTIAEGKQMLRLGFLISMSGLITLGFSYLVRIFITRQGGLVELGLYSAGFVIINTYVGLVFTAMGTDYYPRLSSVVHRTTKTNETINNQIEISLIILGPILCGFILFVPWLIQILYSNQFLAVNEMLVWAAVGMFFKAVSWCIAFLFLAKGSSKLFFWNELVANIYLTLFNIIGYYCWGLTGMGYSFVLSYFVYMVQVWVLTKYSFDFNFGFVPLTILVVQVLFATLSLLSSSYLNGCFFYIMSVAVIFSNLFYTYYLLVKRLDINSMMKKLLNNRKIG